MSDSDEDIPKLSAHTLKALQEFYSDELNRETESGNHDGNIAPTFKENWQLSQFWYDDKTTEALAKEALRVAGPSGKIALISCPTLYSQLKKELPNCQVTLFEFDNRFATYGEDFIFYNYEKPLDIPRELAGVFDVVLADPPFLSEECLTKTAVTVKFLAKSKIILCTGTVMNELVQRLLDLSKAEFEPHHQNNLANEFSCFCNYDIDKHILS